MVHVAVLDDYQGVALEMADWSSLGSGVEAQVFRDHLKERAALVERLRDFEVVAAMRERTPFPKETLEHLPSLQLLVTTGMRNASVDMEAATRLGIMVCGTGGLGYPTAELTWGLILALVRHIPNEDQATRGGRWQVTLGAGLQGKVLGIIGLGNLGSQVATIGRAFGMSVIAWSQNLAQQRAQEYGATMVSKEELLSQADIVTVHLVLSQRTRGLIGDQELGMMKLTTFLINTSRGPIVEEGALIEALQRKAIAGAGLDVFDEEPLPPDHPFLRLENTVLTPHLGYVTTEAYRIFFRDVVEDIQAFLQRDPVRVLNPEVLTSAALRKSL